MLWERTEEQGWAGLSCCVLVAVAGWLTSPSVGPSPTPRPPPQPSSPQLSLAERVCLLERTCYLGGLNAESIQLRHPPLHLTFQGTRISRLRCQTFSTCFFFFFFASVPDVDSSGVSGGWGGGELGQQRLMLKWRDEGETQATGPPSTFGATGFGFCPRRRSEQKCQNQFSDLKKKNLQSTPCCR